MTDLPAMEHARTLYTEGRCGEFAAALHDLTGWEIVIAHREDALNNLFHWYHALCRRPDGTYVDVYGPQGEDGVTNIWSRWLEAGERLVFTPTPVKNDTWLVPDGATQGWFLDRAAIALAKSFILHHPLLYLPELPQGERSCSPTIPPSSSSSVGR